MSGKTYKINTAEELVAWVTANHWRADMRWQMVDRSVEAYDNQEEGKAWTELYRSEERRLGWETPEWEETRGELLKMEPASHRYTEYVLRECGDTYHSDQIKLGEELGKAIDDAWTKRTVSWDSHKQRTGALTVPGMLKRLGNREIGEQIAAAKLVEKAKAEKNRRNYARRELKRLAAEAEKLVDSLSMTTAATLDDLLALVEEE